MASKKKAVKKKPPQTADIDVNVKIMYRFVVVGDLHLRRTDPLGIVEDDGMNSRLRDKLNSLQTIIQYACENNASHLVFLGDVFDAINPPEWLKKLFWETVKPALQRNIQVRIIIGNHDRTGMTYNFSGDAVIVSDNIKIFTDHCIEDQKLPGRPQQDMRVWYLPYKKQEDILENLHCASSSCVPDIVFGHFEIDGAELAPDNTQIRHGVDQKEVPGRLVWLGHIHKFQEFRAGFAYIGSCVKCDFGEVNNQKVFGKVDIYEDGQMKFQYNEIPQRPMYQYNVQEDDPNNLYISEQIPKELKQKGVLIKFKLIGSAEWVKSIDKFKFRKRFKNAVRVVFQDVKVDTDRKKTQEINTSKMEDHVHFHIKEKKKGKEYLTPGLELAKFAQSRAEEVEV